jgi:hypothetical protein
VAARRRRSIARPEDGGDDVDRYFDVIIEQTPESHDPQPRPAAGGAATSTGACSPARASSARAREAGGELAALQQQLVGMEGRLGARLHKIESRLTALEARPPGAPSRTSAFAQGYGGCPAEASPPKAASLGGPPDAKGRAGISRRSIGDPCSLRQPASFASAGGSCGGGVFGEGEGDAGEAARAPQQSPAGAGVLWLPGAVMGGVHPADWGGGEVGVEGCVGGRRTLEPLPSGKRRSRHMRGRGAEVAVPVSGSRSPQK